MFCAYCGAEIKTPDSMFCSRCGQKIHPGKEENANGLLFVDLDYVPSNSSRVQIKPRERSLQPWNAEPIRCEPYELGPHLHKYAFHGTLEGQGVKMSGGIALTPTGLQFISKHGNILLYYESMLRVEKTDFNTIAIISDSGKTYEFKVAFPEFWIDKIRTMSRGTISNLSI